MASQQQRTGAGAAQRAYNAAHSAQPPWKQRFRQWLQVRAKTQRWHSAQWQRQHALRGASDDGDGDAMPEAEMAEANGDADANDDALVDDGDVEMADVVAHVAAQWALFAAESDEGGLEAEALTREDALDLALFLQESLRRDEEEARTLALYEESEQFELEQLEYQLAQWNIG